jgi:hypothetical protein
MRHSTLTGSWSGAYRYPNDHGPETVFGAHFDQAGDALTGWIQEPDLTGMTDEPVLHAQILGSCTNQTVTFTKTYNHEAITQVIHYTGVINASLSRIDGRWTISKTWSGTFFMTRDDVIASG